MQAPRPGTGRHHRVRRRPAPTGTSRTPPWYAWPVQRPAAATLLRACGRPGPTRAARAGSAPPPARAKGLPGRLTTQRPSAVCASPCGCPGRHRTPSTSHRPSIRRQHRTQMICPVHRRRTRHRHHISGGRRPACTASRKTSGSSPITVRPASTPPPPTGRRDGGVGIADLPGLGHTRPDHLVAGHDQPHRRPVQHPHRVNAGLATAAATVPDTTCPAEAITAPARKFSPANRMCRLPSRDLGHHAAVGVAVLVRDHGLPAGRHHGTRGDLGGLTVAQRVRPPLRPRTAAPRSSTGRDHRPHTVHRGRVRAGRRHRAPSRPATASGRPPHPRAAALAPAPAPPPERPAAPSARQHP